MRSSFIWRSTTARTTAVIASNPPRRSYRESSTIPLLCSRCSDSATSPQRTPLTRVTHRQTLYPAVSRDLVACRLQAAVFRPGYGWGLGAVDDPQAGVIGLPARDLRARDQ